MTIQSCEKLLYFRKRYSVYAYLATHFLLSGTPINKRHCQQSRTDNLHRSITFRNQSAGLSASEGRPLADFRRIGEHSDCFANTVWALCASLFVKQSIGGAARQENQQVASGSRDIALDIENLPCANGRSETLKPNLAVVILSRWPGKWCTYNPKNRNFKK